MWLSADIESVFTTVRHRSVRFKGAFLQETARLMVFKLVTVAVKAWRRRRSENQSPKVIESLIIKNGVEVINTPAYSGA